MQLTVFRECAMRHFHREADTDLCTCRHTTQSIHDTWFYGSVCLSSANLCVYASENSYILNCVGIHEYNVHLYYCRTLREEFSREYFSNTWMREGLKKVIFITLGPDPPKKVIISFLATRPIFEHFGKKVYFSL